MMKNSKHPLSIAKAVGLLLRTLAFLRLPASCPRRRPGAPPKGPGCALAPNFITHPIKRPGNHPPLENPSVFPPIVLEMQNHFTPPVRFLEYGLENRFTLNFQGQRRPTVIPPRKSFFFDFNVFAPFFLFPLPTPKLEHFPARSGSRIKNLPPTGQAGIIPPQLQPVKSAVWWGGFTPARKAPWRRNLPVYAPT